MEYKEFAVENGKEVMRDRLVAELMPREDYALAHASLPIVCHDVAIFYHGSVLLVKRDTFPAKDEWCVVGGRVLRGVEMEESLRRKAKAECGLDLVDIQLLGAARGRGVLELDMFHSQPLLLKEEEFTQDVKKELHSYVVEILEKAFLVMKKKD